MKQYRNVKKLSAADQHALAAKIMAGWHTSAEKDERYNKERATVNCAVGNRIMCEFYRRETGWCDVFSGERKEIMEHEREMAKHV